MAEAKLLARGDVVLVRLPEHLPTGHEQQGTRPAVVVGIPELLGRPRFPVVLVVPLTSDRGQPWAFNSPQLYPRLPAGAGGLPSASLALVDQTRGLGLERVASFLGGLTPEECRPSSDALQRMVGGALT